MNNYTGHGWEGKKLNKDLNTVEVAKLIRQEIKKKYNNGIKVSVKSKSYANGSSINAKITACPFDVTSQSYREYSKTDTRLPFMSWADENFKEKKMYTKKANDLIKDIQKIGDQYRFDDSDCRIDYSHNNFYWFVGIAYELGKSEL